MIRIFGVDIDSLLMIASFAGLAVSFLVATTVAGRLAKLGLQRRKLFALTVAASTVSFVILHVGPWIVMLWAYDNLPNLSGGWALGAFGPQALILIFFAVASAREVSQSTGTAG
jgi:biotin transporter BioY